MINWYGLVSKDLGKLPQDQTHNIAENLENSLTFL